MPNEMDVHKILTRLKKDSEMELMQYDLEKLLEDELSKEECEMDTALVEELLKTLEESPSADEKEKTWRAIERRAKRKTGRLRTLTARRIAACFLALIALSALSIGSALAFNWSSLLKFIKPLAESFGIYSVNTPGDPEPVQTDKTYGAEDTGFLQATYNSLEEMPDKWNGFRVLPAWMPERFTFLQGSGYDDEHTAIFSVTYMAGDAFFNLSTNFFYDDADISSYEYQMTPTNSTLEIIADHEVTYYLNTDTKLLAASWIDQNVHYSIFGDINEEEMRRIILSIVKS